MPRILLLEDEPDLLDMLEVLLVASGFEVSAAATKHEGVEMLQRTAYDLVLTDLMLGSRDIEAAWRSVEDLVALARPAPVGIVTGWASAAKEAPAHGVSFVVTKPATREALLTAVRDALSVPPLTDVQQSTVRAYFDRIEHHAYEELAALCTEDVVYEVPCTDPRSANVIRGRDAFLRFTDETFRTLREPQFEIGSMHALPNGAMVEYLGSWSEDDRSRRRLPGVVTFEFRQDRIARIGVRFDPRRMQ